MRISGEGDQRREKQWIEIRDEILHMRNLWEREEDSGTQGDSRIANIPQLTYKSAHGDDRGAATTERTRDQGLRCSNERARPQSKFLPFLFWRKGNGKVVA